MTLSHCVRDDSLNTCRGRGLIHCVRCGGQNGLNTSWIIDCAVLMRPSWTCVPIFFNFKAQKSRSPHVRTAKRWRIGYLATSEHGLLSTPRMLGYVKVDFQPKFNVASRPKCYNVHSKVFLKRLEWRWLWPIVVGLVAYLGLTRRRRHRMISYLSVGFNIVCSLLRDCNEV